MVRPGEGLAAIPLETRHFEDLGRCLLEPMTELFRDALVGHVRVTLGGHDG